MSRLGVRVGTVNVFKGCTLPIGFGLDPQNHRQMLISRDTGYEFVDL